MWANHISSFYLLKQIKFLCFIEFFMIIIMFSSFHLSAHSVILKAKIG